MQMEKIKRLASKKIKYRIYKLTFVTTLIEDKNFIANFSCIVRQLAENLAICIVNDKKSSIPVGLQDANRYIPSIRQIAFYDTAHYDLYRHGFILRKRSYCPVASTKQPEELTLKFRHADKKIAARINLCAPTMKSEVKFKKQIFNTQWQAIKSLYAHSITVTFLPLLIQQGMGGLSQVFPVLSELTINPDEKLHQVNQVNIEESVIELCQMRLYKNMLAQAVIIIWRNLVDKTPLAVEFELRVKREKPGKFDKKTKELLKTYYQSLQTAAHNWLADGTTKTALIYSIKDMS